MFRLNTFGATALLGPDGEAYAGLGAKALGLLVAVAESAPTPMSRDALVDLLWERVEPNQGRASLRQEIRRFKKVMGDDAFAALFQVTDNSVTVNLTRLDYDARALQATADADDAGADAVMALYRGDFLADNAARAEPFQDWARDLRQRYEEQALAAVTQAARRDLAEGRHDPCLQAAKWVIRADPLQETAQETLVRALLADGRRAQARSAFERFRDHMLNELGVEPSGELAELVAAASEAPRPVKPARAELPVDKPQPTIAVLNVSRGNAEEQAYLAAGVVEELVANLARSSWIRVASLNAPFMPREPGVDLAQRDLRGAADYILRVNVQVAGERASIVATLNRVADNETMFSDTMHAGADDLLSLQRETAIRIASIFEEKVMEDQGEQLKDVDWGAPVDMDHWRTLMRARWLFWRTGRRSNAEAQRLLLEALRMKPDDAPTLCILSFSLMLDGWTGWVEQPRQTFDMARNIAQRAVKAAPNNAWAQFTLGAASATPETLREAKTRMQRALALAPSLVCAIGDLARIHAFHRETADALRLADEAMALSPYDQHYGLWIRTQSIAHYLDGNLDKALSLIDYGIVVREGWFQNYFLKAAILAELDRIDEAAAALASGQAMIGDYGLDALKLGHPFLHEEDLHRFVSALNRVGADYRI